VLYGCAVAACGGKHACTHARTHACTHAHARTHARTRAHAHASFHALPVAIFLKFVLGSASFVFLVSVLVWTMLIGTWADWTEEEFPHLRLSALRQ
jgi:hypothetical protein